MAARRPIHHGGDVSDTLTDLEAKLRDLERELSSVDRASAAPAPIAVDPPAAYATPVMPVAAQPSMPGVPPASAATADVLVGAAHERLAGLDTQVDELLRFREALQRSARQLEEEYARVLARLGAGGRADITPVPIVAPLLAAPLGGRAEVLAPAPYVAPAEAFGPFEGSLVVDAGAFTDIADLSAFEQALAGLPSASDVYVSGFEGDRALIELKLHGPTDVVGEMRATVPFAFTVTEAGAGRLRVDLGPGV